MFEDTKWLMKAVDRGRAVTTMAKLNDKVQQKLNAIVFIQV